MKAVLADAPHVLITGTSGAIGGAIAREIRARRPNAALTLVDRLEAESKKLAAELGGKTHVEVVDLSSSAVVPELVTRARRAHGPIDGLVNAAGVMQVMRFQSLEWERAEALLTVDLVTPLRLLHGTVDEMIERKSGFIVNVTSMAGRVPLKGCAFYGAAKAGLSMASEIAHAELAGRGVHVVTVYPGPVASELERNARAQYQEGVLARAVPLGRPNPLARRVLDAIEERRARVIYPPWYAVGFRAPGLASRFSLAFGPDPLS